MLREVNSRCECFQLACEALRLAASLKITSVQRRPEKEEKLVCRRRPLTSCSDSYYRLQTVLIQPHTTRLSL